MRHSRYTALLFAGMLAFGVVIGTHDAIPHSHAAPSEQVTEIKPPTEMQPSQSHAGRCNGGRMAASVTEDGAVGWLTCLPLQPTHNKLQWHPPTDHEHGHAPPDWLTSRSVQVSYEGPFQSSSIENADPPTGKHHFMKGYAQDIPAGGGQVRVYLRYHGSTNPHERMAHVHSYQMWALDPAGNLSSWQGWFDAGDPQNFGTDTGHREHPTDCGPGPTRRPVVAGVTPCQYQGGHRTESWYNGFFVGAGLPNEEGWVPAIGLNMEATTRVKAGEYQTATDMTTWDRTGSQGLRRRFEVAWPSLPFGVHRGDFYATQFGRRVNGPTDPVCGSQAMVRGVSYTVVCLPQTVQPSLPEFEQAVDIAFPGPSVVLPNLILPVIR